LLAATTAFVVRQQRKLAEKNGGRFVD